jgi:DNA-binding winged helix-turn-helix (wHTH) protein
VFFVALFWALMRIQFGSFTLDSDTRQLLDGGGEVRLTPKAFDLLVLLVQERPKVVPRRDLLARIWPNTHVVESNLNVLVGELRRALGDQSKEPTYIRTVHATGFAFAAEAFPIDPSTRTRAFRCWLMWAERRFVLEEGSNLIGRDPRCDVWLDASRVSREHARITVASATGRVTIEDIGSTNGTVVNRKAIEEPVPLEDGDAIEIGSVELRFRVWAGEKQAETERIPRRKR